MYDDNENEVYVLLNMGIHTMMTRKHKHFQVMHANTNRLQEIPVIYLQIQLNMEIQRNKEFDKIWNTWQFLWSFILVSVNPSVYLDYCTHLSLKIYCDSNFLWWQYIMMAICCDCIMLPWRKDLVFNVVCRTVKWPNGR